MRKNNIELRKSTDNDGMFEIIKWYTNPYHKNKELYEKIGMYYTNENNTYIHQDCFINSELCYVLSFINAGIVRFIGNRAIDLNNINEYKDYLFLLRAGIKKSIKIRLK